MPLDKDFVIKYGADFSDVQRQIQQLDSINQRMTKTLGNEFQKATRVVGTSVDNIQRSTSLKKTATGFKEVNQELIKTGTIIQTADGRFREYTETTKVVNGNVKRVSGSLKDVTGQFARTNVETEKSKKNFLSMGENLKRLAKRAVLTIPVWFALRLAIQGTFRTIRDGLGNLASLDRSLQKARRNLRGTAEQITSDFKTLREEAQKLSIESGTAVEKIINAFQKFATTGLDFETSMAGAIGATKLATTLFGDTEEIANQVARAFRVLGDESGKNGTQAEQLTKLYAQLDTLWQDNAFTISEFGSAFEKFAPTARTSNIALSDTVAILSALQTAGIRGSRAGRLLRTSIQKLVLNLDKLAPTLGIKVNPQLDTTASLLLKVLSAIEELNKTSAIAPEATEAISEIFGGVRGAEPIKALIALRKELDKNLKVTGDVEKFNKTFEDVNATLGKQVDIFKNLNREIGKAFVGGLVGGEDWIDTLTRINEKLRTMLDVSDEAGDTIGKLFAFNVFAPIGSALVDFTKIANKVGDIFKDINRALAGELADQEFIDLLARIQIATEDNLIEVSPQTIKQLDLKLKKQIADETDKAPITVQPDIIVDPNFIAFKDIQEISKQLLDIELDILKNRGATTSQILEAESALSKQLGIEEDSLDVLRRKLELEKAVNEEKRLQNNLSSQSVKLFDIANKEGLATAKNIGEVLAGQKDFSLFVRRGGKDLEVFKETFADIFKQQQALAFFQGEQVPGITGLRGGADIPIREGAIRDTGRAFDPTVALRQARAQQIFRELQVIEPVVKTDINVNVDISNLDEIKNKVNTALANEIKTVGTKTYNAVKDVVLNI